MLNWVGRTAIAVMFMIIAFSVQAQQCNSSMSRSEMRQNLKLVADDLLQRWPNAGAAIAESNAYDIPGTVWWWSHMKKSVDGFGPTMGLLNGQPPLPGSHGDGDGRMLEGATPKLIFEDNPNFRTPNLLFFKRTGEKSSWREWPLIGFGYPTLFEPCDKPTEEIPCFSENDWFIHEAGYHRVIAGGDGGMTLATNDDLCLAPWPNQGFIRNGCGKSEFDVMRLDPQGCEDIDTEDIEQHANRIRHGRYWDLHVWINPNKNKKPRIAILDPFERWKNAPSGRIAMHDLNRAFYYQDTEACLCGTPQQIDLVAARNGSCRNDAHCKASEYCDAGVDFKANQCRSLKADNQTCDVLNGGRTCKSGKCKGGRCYTPNSVAPGEACYVTDACDGGKCSGSIDGVKGICVCKLDSDCSAGQYCDAGVDFNINQCRSLKADNQTCDVLNGGRTCKSGKCKGGRCYTPNSVAPGEVCYVTDACDGGKCSGSIDGVKGTCVCKLDSDCSAGQYCDAGVDFNINQCKNLKADNQTCDIANGGRTCQSGKCKFGRCYTPDSVKMGGVCYVDAACDGGKCSSVEGTKGTCVCQSDGDCSSGYWCDKGFDFNKNQCKRKYNKGEVCGTVGELGVGHRCKSGKCRVTGFSNTLKCK